jgi:hypothetical protein
MAPTVRATRDAIVTQRSARSADPPRRHRWPWLAGTAAVGTAVGTIIARHDKRAKDQNSGGPPNADGTTAAASLAAPGRALARSTATRLRLVGAAAQRRLSAAGKATLRELLRPADGAPSGQPAVEVDAPVAQVTPIACQTPAAPTCRAATGSAARPRPAATTGDDPVHRRLTHVPDELPASLLFLLSADTAHELVLRTHEQAPTRDVDPLDLMPCDWAHARGEGA